MACRQGAAAVEATEEDMTSDFEWIEPELDSDWVFVNTGNNRDDAGEGNPDSSGRAAAQNPQDHKEERDVDEDGNEDQNIFQSIMGRDTDAAYGFCSRNESALGFHDGACEIGVGSGIRMLLDDEDEDDDEDREEEEDQEDNDEYSDALHDGALQEELNMHSISLMDAMERHYVNPVRECLHEYICSVQTATRRELHETKMATFRGFGPQPRPFLIPSNCFNPHFEAMWLPWAISVEYFHNEDMGLLVSDGTTGLTHRTLAAKRYMSSAVPILPVLEYMVNHSPGKNIAHIGSYTSLYWAALLEQLGAANVIVTEGTNAVTYTTPADYPCIEHVNEETFFIRKTTVDQALFFLRPSKRSSDAQPCMAERFLFCFPGDTIFFVGERGEHADNFDMAQWAEEHALEGWRVEIEMDIPCWPGSHDVFLCITKGSLSVGTAM